MSMTMKSGDASPFVWGVVAARNTQSVSPSGRGVSMPEQIRQNDLKMCLTTAWEWGQICLQICSRHNQDTP